MITLAAARYARLICGEMTTSDDQFLDMYDEALEKEKKEKEAKEAYYLEREWQRHERMEERRWHH